MIARSPDFEKLAALMSTTSLTPGTAVNGWGKPVAKRNTVPVTNAAIKLAMTKQAGPMQFASKMMSKVPVLGRMFRGGAAGATAGIRPPNPFSAGGPSSFTAPGAAGAPGLLSRAFTGTRNWVNSTKAPGNITKFALPAMFLGQAANGMLGTYATSRGMTDWASGFADGGANALGAYANATPFQRFLGAIAPDAMVNEGLKMKQQAMPWLARLMGGDHYLNRTAEGYKRITEAARAGKPLRGMDKLAPVGGMSQYTQGPNLGDYGQQLTALQQQIASLGQQLQRGVGASALPPAM